MYFKRKKLIFFSCFHFRFYGSSGLLKSKIDESGSYLYEYDIYGRLVKAILPTGQAIGLQFNLTSQGAAIDVMKNGIMSEVVLVQDQLVSTFFPYFQYGNMGCQVFKKGLQNNIGFWPKINKAFEGKYSFCEQTYSRVQNRHTV